MIVFHFPFLAGKFVTFGAKFKFLAGIYVISSIVCCESDRLVFVESLLLPPPPNNLPRFLSLNDWRKQRADIFRRRLMARRWAASASRFSHRFWRAQNLLKLLPMMGMGRPMTRTPKMAQKQPMSLPIGVTGVTSPQPT